MPCFTCRWCYHWSHQATATERYRRIYYDMKNTEPSEDHDEGDVESENCQIVGLTRALDELKILAYITLQQDGIDGLIQFGLEKTGRWRRLSSGHTIPPILHVLGAADSDLSNVILCSNDKLYVKVSEKRIGNGYRVRVRNSIRKRTTIHLDISDMSTIKLIDYPDYHLEYNYERNFMIVTNRPVNARSRFIIKLKDDP